MGFAPVGAAAQAQNADADFPDTLVDTKPRDITPLPMNPDGSAPEYPPSSLTPEADFGVNDHLGSKKAQVELDPAKARIRIYGNVMGQRGSLRLQHLQTLPPHSQITKLQCGSPKPSGIEKWSGVRFSDVCRLLKVDPMARYVMFVGADGYISTEPMSIAMHPQTLLVWQMNDKPLTEGHGAPFRMILATQWGGRSTKRLEQIRFTATSFSYNNS